MQAIEYEYVGGEGEGKLVIVIQLVMNTFRAMQNLVLRAKHPRGRVQLYKLSTALVAFTLLLVFYGQFMLASRANLEKDGGAEGNEVETGASARLQRVEREPIILPRGKEGRQQQQQEMVSCNCLYG